MKNIVISEKQLETLTNLVKNQVSENIQEKDSMAKKQLFTIGKINRYRLLKLKMMLNYIKIA
jgi:hypothetical protein